MTIEYQIREQLIRAREHEQRTQGLRAQAAHRALRFARTAAGADLDYLR